MQWLKDILGSSWEALRTSMGMFGAESPKPTKLYGSMEGQQHLRRILDGRDFEVLDIARHYIDSKGISRVQGGSDLKQTQAYPIEFGREVARLWETFTDYNMGSCLDHFPDFMQMLPYASTDDWADADMKAVFDDLELMWPH